MLPLITANHIRHPAPYEKQKADMNGTNVNKKIWLDLVELLLCRRF